MSTIWIGLIVGLVIGIALGSVLLALFIWSREGEANARNDWVRLNVGADYPLPAQSVEFHQRLDD